jgi:hypothetical protein
MTHCLSLLFDNLEHGDDITEVVQTIDRYATTADQTGLTDFMVDALGGAYDQMGRFQAKMEEVDAKTTHLYDRLEMIAGKADALKSRGRRDTRSSLNPVSMFGKSGRPRVPLAPRTQMEIEALSPRASPSSMVQPTFRRFV